MIYAILTPEGDFDFRDSESDSVVQTFAFDGGRIQLRYDLDGAFYRRVFDGDWSEWELSGPTVTAGAARPAEPALGLCFFDTTLSQPVWWNGTDWVDAMGDPV